MNSANDDSDDDRFRPPSLLSELNTKDPFSFSTDFASDYYSLSPDIRSPESNNSEVDPLSPPGPTEDSSPSYECIGTYLLYEKVSTSATTTESRKAVHLLTKEEFICKIFPRDKYQEILAPYWRAGYHPHIANIVEILLGKTQAYVIFQRTFKDLHSYIREKRRLKEHQVAELFSQIISAVKHCHKRGIVLRDLKLRKFVFVDEQRSHLILDGLEDACTLKDSDDDHLTDKHGCPAYVSPEILSSSGYSGKSADIWSLGVILYTLLFGQYPFHATVANLLFNKIASGSYKVPDVVSGSAKCLVRGLLRKEPSERLVIEEVCRHPWFEHVVSRSAGIVQPTRCSPPHAGASGQILKPNAVVTKETEQKVPDVAGPRPMREFGIY